MPTQRQQVVERIIATIPSPVGHDCVLVGIDGGDGAGKTTFADDLATAIATGAQPAIRISVDDFHQPREARYRRGRSSPSGFWLDSFDYLRLHQYVLEPLGPGGNRRFRPRAHDLISDQHLEEPEQLAPPGAIVIIDGLFLHRPELRQHWSFTVFLEVPFTVTARRMAIRDGSNPDPDHPTMKRYTEAQRRYRLECDPLARASLVIDNTNPAVPVIMK